jgi:hypothetical protein
MHDAPTDAMRASARDTTRFERRRRLRTVKGAAAPRVRLWSMANALNRRARTKTPTIDGARCRVRAGHTMSAPRRRTRTIRAAPNPRETRPIPPSPARPPTPSRHCVPGRSASPFPAAGRVLRPRRVEEVGAAGSVPTASGRTAIAGRRKAAAATGLPVVDSDRLLVRAGRPRWADGGFHSRRRPTSGGRVRRSEGGGAARLEPTDRRRGLKKKRERPVTAALFICRR